MALGAGKQQSVSKPRTYFYDPLHRRTRARGYTPENGLGAPGCLSVVCLGCNEACERVRKICESDSGNLEQLPICVGKSESDCLLERRTVRRLCAGQKFFAQEFVTNPDL
jgi:hypothetical protein